jgi:hypothetical protein
MTIYHRCDRNSCSKQCDDLQTGAQPYRYLPRMKLRPHQHPPNPFTWYLVRCW